MTVFYTKPFNQVPDHSIVFIPGYCDVIRFIKKNCWDRIHCLNQSQHLILYLYHVNTTQLSKKRSILISQIIKLLFLFCSYQQQWKSVSIQRKSIFVSVVYALYIYFLRFCDTLTYFLIFFLNGHTQVISYCFHIILILRRHPKKKY